MTHNDENLTNESENSTPSTDVTTEQNESDDGEKPTEDSSTLPTHTSKASAEGPSDEAPASAQRPSGGTKKWGYGAAAGAVVFIVVIVALIIAYFAKDGTPGSATTDSKGLADQVAEKITEQVLPKVEVPAALDIPELPETYGYRRKKYAEGINAIHEKYPGKNRPDQDRALNRLVDSTVITEEDVRYSFALLLSIVEQALQAQDGETKIKKRKVQKKIKELADNLYKSFNPFDDLLFEMWGIYLRTARSQCSDYGIELKAKCVLDYSKMVRAELEKTLENEEKYKEEHGRYPEPSMGLFESPKAARFRNHLEGNVKNMEVYGKYAQELQKLTSEDLKVLYKDIMNSLPESSKVSEEDIVNYVLIDTLQIFMKRANPLRYTPSSK